MSNFISKIFLENFWDKFKVSEFLPEMYLLFFIIPFKFWTYNECRDILFAWCLACDNFWVDNFDPRGKNVWTQLL